MAKKKASEKSDETTQEPKVVVEELTPTPIMVGMAVSTPTTPVVVKSAVHRISFDRWFTTTGRPSRHKAGMKAYVNTNGRKTKTAWDQLFAAY